MQSGASRRLNGVSDNHEDSSIIAEKLRELSMSDITCLIPTHNRPFFLRRLLHFLEQTSADFRLLIVDSSRPEFRSSNELLIAQMRRSLKISYRHSDECFVTKCRQAIDSIETPLTFCCADDDFPIPTGVSACAEFLRQNADYTIAQGVKLSYSTTKGLYVLHGYDVDHDDAEQRFQQFAAHWFCTLFATCRTAALQHSFRITDQATDYDRARIFPELMWTQMGVLQGKLKHLQVAYNLREEHQLNESTVVPEIADREHRTELYEGFRNAIAGELSEFSGTTTNEALKTVDQCYGYLLAGRNRKDRSVSGRVRREGRRQWHRLLDMINREQVLQRRRLKMADPLCSDQACQLALQLTQQYPLGIKDDAVAAA
ncbi:MAG: glycosyltransferase domain-containing protein [Planctomycetaceae bacterium]